MPYPMLNKHSEKQYLELETNFLNLFIFVQSLMTHTEGEHLDSNSHKLNHFDALCIRVSEGVERFSDFAQQVQDVKFKGDSTTTTSYNSEPAGYPTPSGKVRITLESDEYPMILEALEHFACMYPDSKTAERFQDLADDIKNLK